VQENCKIMLLKAEFKVITDIIALIEFIEERLIRRRTQNQRNIIEDFVNPVFLLFEKVHNDYLETFHEYKTQIRSISPLRLTLTIEEIERDRLFSDNLRAELLSTLSAEHNLVNEFLLEINEYLESPRVFFSNSSQPWSNTRRNGLIEILNWIDNLTPELAIDSGLVGEFKNSVSDKRNLDISGKIFSSLQLTIRSSEYEINQINDPDYQTYVNEVGIQLDEIKRFLAIQCIDFILNQTKENFNLVVQSYWRIKMEVIGLRLN
jgi:hypothetical protein